MSFLVTGVLALALFSACKSAPSQLALSGDFAQQCIQLQIEPATVSPNKLGQLELKYELQNTCPFDKTVCVWPALACEQAWQDDHGGQHSAPSEVRDPKVCPLERLTVLTPGQRLAGRTEIVAVHPADGRVVVRCDVQTYGSGDSQHVKKSARIVYSNRVYIDDVDRD
jgi:hypothetical protein